MVLDSKYLAPTTVEEALALLARYKEESRVIAGGQSLLILIQQGLLTPKYLIDIKGISALNYVNFDKNEGLKIGSLTTHRAVETSSVIRNSFSILCEMEEEVASIQIRNRGTIGGNICHADPSGDPCPVLIVLNGRVKIASRGGERTVAVEEFTKDYFETVLQDDEILTEIQVPIPPPRTGSAYTKFRRVLRDATMVSAAVLITLNSKDKTCSDVRIALGGVASIPLRAKKAERVLVGREIEDALLEEATQVASEEASPVSDMNASEEYKRELVKVLVKRVAIEALARAQRA